MISSGSHPRGLARALQLAALAAAFSISVACAGGEETPGTADSPAPGDTPTGQVGGFTPEQITPQMVALGDSIFRGQAANGICYTCHGPEAAGTQLGPDLTDQEWIQGDGSLQFIVNNIRTGVPQPTQYPGMMPAFGPLFTEDQLRAVAAYVYSRSHPDFQVGGGD